MPRLLAQQFAPAEGGKGGAARGPVAGGAARVPAIGGASLGPESPEAEKIEVVVRHAVRDTAVRVRLPERARFSHLKRALARGLGSDEILAKGFLGHKEDGIYREYQDETRVGDVREALVVCADLGDRTLLDGDILGELSDGEVSEDVEEDDEALEADVGGDGAFSDVASVASKTSRTSRTSRASRRSARRRNGGTRRFSKKQALSLQRELLAGFTDRAFQRKLANLRNEHLYSPPNCADFVQERQELFLSVQSQVLPKYGFEGSMVGVFRMIGAMSPYVEDPDFVSLAEEVNAAVGIVGPAAGWSTLAASCRKLDALAEGAAAKRRPAAASSASRSAASSSLAHVRGPPTVESKGGGGGASPSIAWVLDDAPEFETWDIRRKQPFRLFIAGSWNDYRAREMQWRDGYFAGKAAIGDSGAETFQLLKNSSWKLTIYPSTANATLNSDHAVRGPDANGHGLKWQIGSVGSEDDVGTQFEVTAQLDRSGSVRLVTWKPSD